MQSRSDAAKRTAICAARRLILKRHARITKAEVLSEIDRLKNQEKLESAKARVAAFRSPAIFTIWTRPRGCAFWNCKGTGRSWCWSVRNRIERSSRFGLRLPDGSARKCLAKRFLGPLQEGDQAFPGQTMVRVFDPTDMLVITQVNEPDGVLLSRPGARRLYASMRIQALCSTRYWNRRVQWPPLRSKVRSSFSWPASGFWIKILVCCRIFPPPWKWSREMKRLRFWIVILVLLGLGTAGVRLPDDAAVQAKATCRRPSFAKANSSESALYVAT